MTTDPSVETRSRSNELNHSIPTHPVSLEVILDGRKVAGLDLAGGLFLLRDAPAIATAQRMLESLTALMAVFEDYLDA